MAEATRAAVRMALPPLLLLAALILALLFPSIGASPLQVVEIFLHHAGILIGHGGVTGAAETIIWNIRLPRVLAAALVGAALAVAGTLFQAVLRNPLADPYVIGTSAGAQLGVTLAFVLPFQVAAAGFGTIQLAAFAGGLLTVLTVYLLARTNGTVPVVTLLLAGFVLSSFLISATTLLTYVSGNIGDRQNRVLSWTLGGINSSSPEQLATTAGLLVIAAAVAFVLAPRLDLLLLGEEQAGHLGVHVERLKLGMIVLASLLTALAVALAGVVAFVGLVVPHAVRMLYGPGHRTLLPIAAIIGAAFVVLCDLVAYLVIWPATLPLGVITAVLGAPFFLHLLRRSRRAYAL